MPCRLALIWAIAHCREMMEAHEEGWAAAQRLGQIYENKHHSNRWLALSQIRSEAAASLKKMEAQK